MGQAFSSSDAVHILTTQAYHYGDDYVEGVVALNCVSELSTSGIFLEVHGYEACNYSCMDSHTFANDDFHGGAGGSRYHSNRREFFSVNAALGPPGTLMPGKYQFGFKFLLPPDLPASFMHSRGGDRGEIVYKLKAYVAKSGFDITDELQLLVHQRPPTATRTLANSAQSDISFCCCFSQGSASMQVATDKDVYLAGQPVHVTVQARNQSSTEFSACYVHLKRRMLLNAYKSAHPSSYNTSRTEDTVATAATPGLKPGEVAEGAAARQVALQLPPNLPPTTIADLVRCVYWLEAELKGGMTTSTLTVQLPLIVQGGPPPAAQHYAQAPPEWQPTKVFGTVDVMARALPAGHYNPPPPAPT